jgi:hypothetical protein
MRRWLSLKEACQYAHISKNRLKDLAVRGIIKGCPDPDNGRGDWIFDARSIDEYRESQMTQPTTRQIALDILKRIRA